MTSEGEGLASVGQLKFLMEKKINYSDQYVVVLGNYPNGHVVFDIYDNYQAAEDCIMNIYNSRREADRMELHRSSNGLSLTGNIPSIRLVSLRRFAKHNIFKEDNECTQGSFDEQKSRVCYVWHLYSDQPLCPDTPTIWDENKDGSFSTYWFYENPMSALDDFHQEADGQEIEEAEGYKYFKDVDRIVFCGTCRNWAERNYLSFDVFMTMLYGDRSLDAIRWTFTEINGKKELLMANAQGDDDMDHFPVVETIKEDHIASCCGRGFQFAREWPDEYRKYILNSKERYPYYFNKELLQEHRK